MEDDDPPPEPRVAWDCDPDAIVPAEPYDEGLDDEDAESEWQVIALDRFGDRLVNNGIKY